MPAYRSSAEAEIRDAVVARIRQHRPNARIIHEINVSTYGPNRIDVLAVDTAEIIAAEIKSAKDKIDRLPAQLAAMQAVAHHTIFAIHEKFLVEYQTNPHVAHYERDGVHYMRDLPEPYRYSSRSEAWVYPEGQKPVGVSSVAHSWRFPDVALQTPLPSGALGLLWSEELRWLCRKFNLAVGKRPNMQFMSNALRWHCNGRDLTQGICLALRTRECAEADPAMEVSNAAA
jgi:hypothetical protein